MSTPDDRRRKSPVDRFRNIIAAEQSQEQTSAGRKYPKGTPAPSLNLPKPGGRREPESLASELPAMPSTTTVYRSEGNRYLPAFWTAASVISLVFNLVLLVAVIALLREVGAMDAAGLGTGVLGGLYSNFQRMDQAHIKTTIPIQTNLPLNLSVPVQTTTGITLAKDVSIPGAHVKIDTPLFNIDAPANVTLPAGTTMDVGMSFNLAVQTQVPVSLDVPVDIAISDTELHPAIVGFQDALRPLYCMITPSAQGLGGAPVCR